MTVPLYTRPTERRRRDIPENPVEKEKEETLRWDQKRDFPSELMARCENGVRWASRANETKNDYTNQRLSILNSCSEVQSK